MAEPEREEKDDHYESLIPSERSMSNMATHTHIHTHIIILVHFDDG